MDRSYPISTLRLSRGLGRPYRDEPFEGSPMFPLSHGSNPQTIHFLRDFPRFVGITGSPSSIKSSGKQPAPGKECSMFFGVTSSWGPSHHPFRTMGLSLQKTLQPLGYPHCGNPQVFTNCPSPHPGGLFHWSWLMPQVIG